MDIFDGQFDPKPQYPSPAPGAIHRAWVWLPHESRPRLYPIDGAGIISLHDLDHPAAE